MKSLKVPSPFAGGSKTNYIGEIYDENMSDAGCVLINFERTPGDPIAACTYSAQAGFQEQKRSSRP